jgi:HEAT repeat protein
VNQRIRIALLLSLALIAGIAFWSAFQKREPVHQGKPVSFWFKKYVFSFSPAREEALETIAEIGPDAVPYLARMLKKKDSTLARAYRSVRPKLPASVGRFLPQPIDPQRRRSDALACLVRLSRSFRSAIPPLLEALNGSETRIQAIQAMREVAPWKAPNEQIIKALAGAAQDDSASVRHEAIGTLFWVGHWALDQDQLKPVIPALVKALDESEPPPARLGAVVALGQIGPAAQEALPVLRKWFTDVNTDTEAKLRVAGAWLEIDPGSATNALNYLIAHKLKGWEPNLAGGIAEFFAKAKWFAPTAIPSLIALLEGDTESRCSAAIGLGRMGKSAVQAVPVLQSNLVADEPAVRLVSALALKEIDPGQTQRVVAVLSGLLRNVTCYADAASALAEMGPAARDAVPALVSLLNHEWPYMREVAGIALMQIDRSHAPKYLPILLELLQRNDLTYESRLRIIETLGGIGPQAPAAIPILTEHLQHRDRMLQLAAAEALLRIDGLQASVVVPFLIEYLRRTDQWDRDRAAQILGQLGPKAKAAAPALREAVNDSNASVRLRATEALRMIEG